MIMVASLATTFYAYWLAPKKGLSQVVVLDMSIVGTLAGVIGARLFHVFVEYPAYYWADPIRVFYFWQGGFVGYGAFIGVTAGVLGYLKFRKLSVIDYADLLALGAPLIVLFIRIGCIGAGCCYGTPTDFPLYFTFTNPASDAGRDFPGVHLHATQLYDLLNAAFIFLTVNYIDAKGLRRFKGQLTLLFFMMYAFFRFLIEFLRGDTDRGVYFNGLISTSQITGLVIIAVCIPLYIYLYKKYPLKRSLSSSDQNP